MEQNKEDVSTSLSFLEIPFNVKQDEGKTVLKTTNFDASIKVSPDVLDPVFLNYIIHIPKKVEKIFKSSPNIKLIFKITDLDYILLKNRYNDDLIASIFVCDYGTFSFEKNVGSSCLFIFQKDSYISNMKAQESKKYKESIKQGTFFEQSGELRIKRQNYIEYQLETGKNIFYINNGEEFYNQLKYLASVLNKKNEYVPKIKSFRESEKINYIKAILTQIPGLSENIASSIVHSYPTFKSLKNALIENKTELCNLYILDTQGQSYRTLGEKLYNLLFASFASTDRNKPLREL